jgi:hypothetical protein
VECWDDAYRLKQEKNTLYISGVYILIPKAGVLKLFLYHGTFQDSGETYGTLLRKMYLKA